MSKQLEVQKAESRFTLDFIGRFGCNTYGGSATVTGSHVNLLSFFIIFDPGTRWEPRRSAPRARQRARVHDVRILSVSSGAPLESRRHRKHAGLACGWRETNARDVDLWRTDTVEP
mgnify:CR=1 FL=1